VLYYAEFEGKIYVQWFVYGNEKDSLYGSDVIAHAITPNGDMLIVSVVETDQKEGNYYEDN
jgi:hypothetical protein